MHPVQRQRVFACGQVHLIGVDLVIFIPAHVVRVGLGHAVAPFLQQLGGFVLVAQAQDAGQVAHPDFVFGIDQLCAGHGGGFGLVAVQPLEHAAQGVAVVVPGFARADDAEILDGKHHHFCLGPFTHKGEQLIFFRAAVQRRAPDIGRCQQLALGVVNMGLALVGNGQQLAAGQHLGRRAAEAALNGFVLAGNDLLAADVQHAFPDMAGFFAFVVDVVLAHRHHGQAGLGVEIVDVLVLAGVKQWLAVLLEQQLARVAVRPLIGADELVFFLVVVDAAHTLMQQRKPRQAAQVIHAGPAC